MRWTRLRQALPGAGLVRRLAAYTANGDPKAALANTIAICIAGNQPFYPLYLYFIVGRDAAMILPSLLTFPLFAAVPALSRRSSLIGRLTMVAAGLANTLICRKILGEASAVGLFFIPCGALGLILFRRRDWAIGAAVLLVSIGLAFLVHGRWGTPLHAFPAEATRSIARLNAFSVTSLMLFMAFLTIRSLLAERRAAAMRSG